MTAPSRQSSSGFVSPLQVKYIHLKLLQDQLLLTQQPSNCSKLIALYIALQSKMIKRKYHLHHTISPSIIKRTEVEIADDLVTTNNPNKVYESPIVLNQKGPDYRRQTVTTEMYDERPLNANDLLDLLPFEKFTINKDEELFSTVPLSEFDLSHLEPDKLRIFIQQL